MMKNLKVKFIPLTILAALTSCSSTAWPAFFKTVENIETNDAITVILDKDAIRSDMDVHVQVDVQVMPKKE